MLLPLRLLLWRRLRLSRLLRRLLPSTLLPSPLLPPPLVLRLLLRRRRLPRIRTIAVVEEKLRLLNPSLRLLERPLPLALPQGLLLRLLERPLPLALAKRLLLRLLERPLLQVLAKRLLLTRMRRLVVMNAVEGRSPRKLSRLLRPPTLLLLLVSLLPLPLLLQLRKTVLTTDKIFRRTDRGGKSKSVFRNFLDGEEVKKL
ncbi:unnamed protein product [Amoebophrya sp. A25]|nr:unnamed protein product [Amoebophrya sp. A25]|eukprot:GSA25T00021257001.1